LLAQPHRFEAGFGAGVEVRAHAVTQPLRLADVDDLTLQPPGG
jgi:hypothetical protein